jgi:translation initiation factor 1 (eIF-1/SUI1)
MGRLQGMGRKKQQRRVPAKGDGKEDPFPGGLGDLLVEQGFTASSDTTEQGPAEQHSNTSSAEDVVARAQRWIVRISKKGRGGREATLLSPRGLGENEDLSSLARRIRKQMGCGASLEGPDILVQGDQRERLERWLVKHDARKVTQG